MIKEIIKEEQVQSKANVNSGRSYFNCIPSENIILCPLGTVKIPGP